ncbi:hypothetical protein PV08_06356 [Exophiala spinifera]|uniref:AMP-dependent synthetase/ligase domain-containing protein n=1 Tax=Exophiala spinifera TaxID=91928 RepID=A0A0D2BCF0_9EURO|nr:uncharacterized protein PV08_06356 [Exophiala spinifera]KIW16305.1 hypothetical protein PV08_06356 [Exophiala spinifera]
MPSTTAFFDRRDLVPSHEGDHILPAEPLFTRLLALAHRRNPRPAIRDVNAGVERTAAELLSDVLRLRRVLQSNLTRQTLDDLRRGQEVFISIVAPGGYEFTVGVLAVLALGAAVSPFSSAQPVTEAVYYITKARSVALLASATTLSLAEAASREIQTSSPPSSTAEPSSQPFAFVPIRSMNQEPPIALDKIKISSNRFLDPNSAGVVIFTSGTTGPPKGAVLSRAAMIDGSLSFAQQMGLDSSDTLLHLLPVHHATGIWVSFFPFLLTGACIEFKSGSFDAEWTWNRWRRGGLTYFTGVPTIYMRMMRWYQENFSSSSSSSSRTGEGESASYKAAAAALKTCLCGTSALPKPIADFWTTLRDGRPIVQRYGSTESGVVFNMSAHPDEARSTPDGSVGEPTVGVDVRLASDDGGSDCGSGGDTESHEGEIVIKSPYMFSKYIYDAEATAAAHTADGYFRSGDVARREGKYFFIVGRASVDIIKSGGYKISALDVERELMALPYIAEAMVVGVPDDEFGQRVGAVVSLLGLSIATDENNETGPALGLERLRDDVRGRLAGYKMPTLLRVIQGELPKSGTGKVMKKTLGPRYFPPDYIKDGDVQIWNSAKKRDAGRPAKL